jgi:hypothetical protein
MDDVQVMPLVVVEVRVNEHVNKTEQTNKRRSQIVTAFSQRAYTHVITSVITSVMPA